MTNNLMQLPGGYHIGGVFFADADLELKHLQHTTLFYAFVFSQGKDG
jgi:hypothetical protein